jgi:glutamate synthase domain-containing protein 3
VIVTGSVGGNIGPGIHEGTIIVGGEARNAGGSTSSFKPTTKDIAKLTKYFEHYGIKATPISMTAFRRRG